MRILTLGDSWTFGSESSNPATMSWPAQMARDFNVEVVNLARPGSSNQRAIRIGIEELCRDPHYDWVILPLVPSARLEILKVGKWYQIWPTQDDTPVGKIFTDFWHPWTDLQYTILEVLKFVGTVGLLGPKLFVTGLSMSPSRYSREISWIEDYKNDNDFRRMGMPLEDFNIGIKDLDRKLKSLKAMHQTILKSQPEYLYDVITNHMRSPEIRNQYGPVIFAPEGHPNDLGYKVLADYFAKKIGLAP